MEPDLEPLRRSPSRLKAVRNARLLDSPAEEAFDSLTQLAAVLLRAPVSFVTVVDAERDFYKSQHGFPNALAQEREMSGTTFCHFTLARSEALVINDTLADERWRTVPTVTTLQVRSYIGVPLTIDGENIGSFCVVDVEPREWSAADREIVKQLGRSATRELMLRAALREAQQAVKAKEAVVAAVAHDLRTPLQILQLNAAILQRTAEPARQPVATRMLAAIAAMQQMTDELLADSANALAAERAPRRMNVAALLADVIETMQMVAAKAGAFIALGDVPTNAETTADYPQIMRTFCNVIGNSIKYSGDGSVITLGAVHDGDFVQFTVADSGIGMSAADAAQAFEYGYQGREGLARGHGAGLGLSLVRSLVEQNGGSVQLASELGKGTTVSITLPCGVTQ